MWTKSYTETFRGITPEKVWEFWSDVDHWHLWDLDIDAAVLDGPFKAGSFFTLKPKGMKSVRIELVEVVHHKSYTDLTRFPGALMYGRHEMEETPEGLKLTTTMTVSGWLSWVWVRLVAQGIVDRLPEQMNALVDLAKKQKR